MTPAERACRPAPSSRRQHPLRVWASGAEVAPLVFGVAAPVPLGNSVRQLAGRLRWDHAYRVWLAALSRLVSRRQLPQVFPVLPATIVRWHRDLVARKWDYASRREPGRPSTGTSVKALIIRMARENRAWGHRRIEGELARMGYAIAASTGDSSGPSSGREPTHAVMEKIRTSSLVLCSYAVQFGQLVFGDG